MPCTPLQLLNTSESACPPHYPSAGCACGLQVREDRLATFEQLQATKVRRQLPRALRVYEPQVLGILRTSREVRSAETIESKRNRCRNNFKCKSIGVFHGHRGACLCSYFFVESLISGIRGVRPRQHGEICVAGAGSAAEGFGAAD